MHVKGRRVFRGFSFIQGQKQSWLSALLGSVTLHLPLQGVPEEKSIALKERNNSPPEWPLGVQGATEITAKVLLIHF